MNLTTCIWSIGTFFAALVLSLSLSCSDGILMTSMLTCLQLHKLHLTIFFSLLITAEMMEWSFQWAKTRRKLYLKESFKTWSEIVLWITVSTYSLLVSEKRRKFMPVSCINLPLKIIFLFCNCFVTNVTEDVSCTAVSVGEEVQWPSYSTLYFKLESELITTDPGLL